MTATAPRTAYQSAVIPYRIRRGRVEICIVTARRGDHWTIPKGHIEPDLKPCESAIKEAYEEAGLMGVVERPHIGSYTYRKRGVRRRVSMYLMRVTEELPVWPEMMVRRREWRPPTAAAIRVKNDDLRFCLFGLPLMLNDEQPVDLREAQ